MQVRNCNNDKALILSIKQLNYGAIGMSKLVLGTLGVFLNFECVSDENWIFALTLLLFEF